MRKKPHIDVWPPCTHMHTHTHLSTYIIPKKTKRKKKERENESWIHRYQDDCLKTCLFAEVKPRIPENGNRTLKQTNKNTKQ